MRAIILYREECNMSSIIAHGDNKKTNYYNNTKTVYSHCEYLSNNSEYSISI